MLRYILAASEAPTDRPNVLGQARRSRILVVDDDDLVRVAAEEQLSSLGVEVVMAARRHPKLLAIVTVGDDDLDMLFTDVEMHNGSGGAALAEQVQRIRPELPIPFASGVPPERLVEHLVNRRQAWGCIAGCRTDERSWPGKKKESLAFQPPAFADE